MLYNTQNEQVTNIHIYIYTYVYIYIYTYIRQMSIRIRQTSSRIDKTHLVSNQPLAALRWRLTDGEPWH